MAEGLKEVNGFLFSDREGKQAEKELQAIRYIDQQISNGDQQKIYNLYRSLVEQHFFQTAVGYDYLRTLQKYLVSNGGIEESKIPPIPVDSYAEMDMQQGENVSSAPKNTKPKDSDPLEVRKLKLQVEKYKSSFRYALIICIVFLFTIGGMFYILSTTDSPTIINYENKIIDKYSSWEEELNARELEINQRERALDATTGEE